jgi:hypothetical protein
MRAGENGSKRGIHSVRQGGLPRMTHNQRPPGTRRVGPRSGAGGAAPLAAALTWAFGTNCGDPRNVAGGAVRSPA